MKTEITKTTSWLTRGYTEEELAKMKEEAIKEAEAELQKKQAEKQAIEEMALIMCGRECCKICIHFIDGTKCAAVVSARKLYNAGYRKQEEGEWVYRENEFGNAYYACSICDCQTRYKENYCSSCGSKMKGGAE